MAVKTISKPSTKIGVSNYTFWVMESDNETTAEYSDGYTLPGTVEIAPTDSGATSNFDADNIAYEVESYVEKMGHELTNADIPAEVENLWRGISTDGVGVEFNQDTLAGAPYCACAWKITKSNGHFRLVKYYKGKYGFASNVGAKTKASEGAPEKQTATATYSATFRDYDGAGYYYIDTDNLPDGVTEEDAVTNWFADVDYKPTAATGA